jgi:hypothetical protein
MSGIFLVHWNENEASARAAKLAKLGHKVIVLSDSKDSSRFKIATPPELFLIDLARIPSHGAR